MLGAKLRSKFVKPLYKVGAVIGMTGINPNVFSIIALVFAGVAAYFLAVQDYLLGLIFVILASGWDCLDGSVARAQGKVSKFGNYLDALIDKYVEIIIYFGFALGGFSVEAYLVITGSLVLSYAKPRAAIVVPIDNRDWPAIGERSDRLLLLILILIFGILLPEFTIDTYTFSTVSMMLYLLAAVVYSGSVQRILYAKRIIKAGGTSGLKD